MAVPNVLLVSPKYPVSTFWNIKATARVMGAGHSAIPLGLLTVAALLPREWNCRLVDRNVHDVTRADLAWADMVMTGGMYVQRPDCLVVIELAQHHGKPVVVGGPDVTSEPHNYEHADFRVVGEAEAILQDFVAAWEAGQRSGTFTAEKFKVDVTTSPVPRYDLLRHRDYLYFAVQFSRGCPFTCEFCDIIELYGRSPRVKTPAQVLGELQVLFDSGYRGHVDFVDDNFIGNKKAVKAFLPHLIEWQRQHDYPFHFSTEASINLADDDELLRLMRESWFFLVFVGVESPDGDTLVAMRKKQNTRRSLSDSVHKIYRAGMFVIAGFIIGFDSERDRVADGLVDCIEDTAIPICMAGLLTALANTQLTRRLQQENRLFPPEYSFKRFADVAGDQCTHGLNFETARPRRDVLADYKSVIDRIYTPTAYFGRLRRVARGLDCYWPPQRGDGKRAWRIGWLSADFLVLGLRLMFQVARRQPLLLPSYARILIDCARDNRASLLSVGIMAAFYLHLGPFSRVVSKAMARQIDDLDRGVWQSPLAASAREQAAARRDVTVAAE